MAEFLSLKSRKTYPEPGKLILRIGQTAYLLNSKLRLMIKLAKEPATEHFPREASELNKLAIKLKKEILKGNITTISVQEIDDATIPALNVLRSQKYQE